MHFILNQTVTSVIVYNMGGHSSALIKSDFYRLACSVDPNI